MVVFIVVSEFGVGFDVVNIKICVKLEGDDYVINGSKMWIINLI